MNAIFWLVRSFTHFGLVERRQPSLWESMNRLGAWQNYNQTWLEMRKLQGLWPYENRAQQERWKSLWPGVWTITLPDRTISIPGRKPPGPIPQPIR